MLTFLIKAIFWFALDTRDAYKIPIYIDTRHKMFSSKMIPNCLKKHQRVPVLCISESDGYSICADCCYSNGDPKGPEHPDPKPRLPKMTPLRETTRKKPQKWRAGPPSLPPARNLAPNNRYETQYNMRIIITNRKLATCRNE